MPNPSPYTPLPTLESIRLLRIEPGMPGQHLKCHLQVVNINESPRYEALSYVWGDPNRLQEISCNGVPTKITLNLHEALDHFRVWPSVSQDLGSQINKKIKNLKNRSITQKSACHVSDTDLKTSPGRLYWIDALCINQVDSEEKDKQIMLMRLIYSRATRVIFWLGKDPNNYVPQAMQFVDIAVKNVQKERRHWRHWRTNSIQNNIALENLTSQKNVSWGFPPFYSSEWKALVWLFSRPWFNRLWVLQEVRIASSSKVFLGDYEIDPGAIRWAAIWFLYKDYHQAGHPLSGSCMNVVHMLNDYRTKKRMEAESSLFQLLLETKGFEVTFPQDRIYALLGMAIETSNPDFPKALTPNFRKPLVDLYREVAIFLIKSYRALTVLNMVDNGYLYEKDWPTWVPRWHEQRPRRSAVPFIAIDMSSLRACAKICSIVEHTQDEKILRVKGVEIDTVTSELIVFNAAEVSTLYDAWLSVEKSIHSAAGLYFNGDSIHNAFNLTLTANHNEFGDVAEKDPDFKIKATEFWRSAIGRNLKVGDKHVLLEKQSSVRQRGEKDDAGYKQGFSSAVATACRRRTFFLTSTGLMGLGPYTMKSGDAIVVLFGGCTPYLLRKVSLWRHIFVGECYVHGLMNGEAIENWQNGKLTSQFFEIQ